MLVYRTLKICSKNKLQPELDYIRSILRDNGYPENIINSSISKKITQFQNNRKKGLKNAPSTYVFFGLAMCPSNLRNKPNLL